MSGKNGQYVFKEVIAINRNKQANDNYDIKCILEVRLCLDSLQSGI